MRVALGLQGAGEGQAELGFVRDGMPTIPLGTFALSGGDQSVWKDVEIPLPPEAAAVGALELRANAAPRGARVLFGDPALTLAARELPPPARARAVVMVVLDGVERADLPPWSSTRSPLTTLSELALAGTTFDSHRGPSTVVASVLASLLTGLPPRAHTVVDGGARLPESMTNLGEIARDASVRTAFFTGVPQTFRAFGFAHGWERFVEYSPVLGTAASGPIDEAATWITEVAHSAPEARMLVLVHARGAHPPWDVPKSRAFHRPTTRA
ncbi:MAG: sulfatase-like hydrolase/transferase [Polyangiaceae bacterium]